MRDFESEGRFTFIECIQVTVVDILIRNSRTSRKGTEKKKLKIEELPSLSLSLFLEFRIEVRDAGDEVEGKEDLLSNKT